MPEAVKTMASSRSFAAAMTSSSGQNRPAESLRRARFRGSDEAVGKWEKGHRCK